MAGLEGVVLWMLLWVAVLVASWLVVSQALLTVAYVGRSGTLVRLVEPLTAPLVRRVVGGVVGVTLTLNATFPGVAFGAVSQDPEVPEAHASGSVYTPVPAGEGAVPGDLYMPRPAGEVEGPGDAPVAGDAVVSRAVEGVDRLDASVAVDIAAPAPDRPTEAVWTVQPGDHLWGIAGTHLVSVLGRAPSEPEHARYWAWMVGVVEPTLRSGDPDLIYPGEVLRLPPISEAGITR